MNEIKAAWYELVNVALKQQGRQIEQLTARIEKIERRNKSLEQAFLEYLGEESE